MTWHHTVARGDVIYVSESQSPFAEDFSETGQHEIQVHIYAEDPADNFIPSSGDITDIHIPNSKNVEIVRHVQSDQPILTITATGTDRGEATKFLKLALDQIIIDGIPTSLHFIQAVLDNDRFERGDLGASFIAEEYPDGFQGGEVNSGHARKIAALWALNRGDTAISLSCQSHEFSYQARIDTVLPKATVTVDEPSDKAAIEFDIRLDEHASDRLVLAQIDGKPFYVQFGQGSNGAFATYRGCRYRISTEP